jgi:hypothetical protein
MGRVELARVLGTDREVRHHGTSSPLQPFVGTVPDGFRRTEARNVTGPVVIVARLPASVIAR